MKQTTFQLLFGFIAGLAIGYFFFHNCNKSKPCPEVKVEQTTKTDTSKTAAPNDSSEWHAPVMSKLRRRGDFKSQYTPITEIPPTPAGDYLNFNDDVSDVVTDYYTERHYSDTNHLKEADVIVQNTVSENKLQQQRVLLQNLKQTVITNTVTKVVTEAPKRKARLYWDLTTITDRDVNINAAGGGLMLQFRDTRALQVNYLYQFNKSYPWQNRNQFQLTLVNPFSKY